MNIFPPNTLVCAYLRDSGGMDQDLSIDQQESEVRAWCANNGLILSNIFRDVAISGSSTISRQGFLEMINHFHGNCPERGLVIWRFSRFARDVDDAQFFKADLRRRGYEIYSIKDQIPDGSTGRLLEAVLDWANERFLEDLSADVRRGQQHLFTQYGALGGYPPPGFVREPFEIGTRRDGRPHMVARWIPDPDPDIRAIIRLAWQMRADGATGADVDRQTHLYQTVRGYYRFFCNALYKGELRFSDHIFPHYCEPIVDEVTWHRVQRWRRNKR
jgi:DNA invertase Pin-like site-specific DNA recombinase